MRTISAQVAVLPLTAGPRCEVVRLNSLKISLLVSFVLFVLASPMTGADAGLWGHVEPSTDPTILFTHIPLHRPETKSCGPLRERGGYIHRGVGRGWQSTLGKQTSEFLLKSLRPVAVFRCDASFV